MSTIPGRRPAVHYPDSDGQPMADNTLQFRWIVTITGNLEALFGDRPDVFVAGDLLWYPVEGDNVIRTAPDALVAFGRPKGDRGSYKQWEEGGIAPQVVFEVLSPGTRAGELRRKFDFYQKFGVEEYYIYDPDRLTLKGWERHGDELRPISAMNGWVSPRLGVRFEMREDGLHLFNPDGTVFDTFAEVQAKRKQAVREAIESERRARAERRRANAAENQAAAERQRAEAAERRAEAERTQAEAERRRADQLAERLRALGIDPEA